MCWPGAQKDIPERVAAGPTRWIRKTSGGTSSCTVPGTGSSGDEPESGPLIAEEGYARSDAVEKKVGCSTERPEKFIFRTTSLTNRTARSNAQNATIAQR